MKIKFILKNVKLSICAFMQTKDLKTLVKSITRKSSLFGKSAKVSKKSAQNRLALIFLAFFPLRPDRHISIPVAIQHENGSQMKEESVKEKTRSFPK